MSTDWTEYFLNSSPSVVMLDCIEISHSLFDETYRVVRNAPNGVTVTHEDSTSRVYSYYPMRVTKSGALSNMEQSIKFEFGDLGEIITWNVDNIRVGGGFGEYPLVKYRAYRSDDLTVPMDGTPITLQIHDFDFNKEGCMFVAKAPSLNVSKTGELFKPARFPMLKGLL